ncbi:oxygen-binding di-iron domain-containing protein [Halodesulfovibrio spirochaetisodalis]|uniref:Metallo-beta-lactamase n=1 Tax=Halodesulfovibrio spirochaetisodalis TaxID=1560234 RepID=A0A1B7XAG8_9BACT|nr:MBL fold metallo-hydrolase [Halodesulfovibrio spirochaetisodalis]OBQ46332.1 metallo-beta-lactamase [Halodesulfovibrio spirochaetisodalis]
MRKKITDNISWVGKIDWEIRTAHGKEYSTHKGTSYNAYLIEDEKTALIDTVWEPYADEFVTNLRREIDLEQIDYIICNHAEPDHSGALPALMKYIPDTPIYCTKQATLSLSGHYHQDWDFRTVTSGDTLSLGENTLTFFPVPMVHWPDSMMTHLSGQNVLFSNDAFGQHYAHELLFNDLADQCTLYEEAIKYYANILTPFSPVITNRIQEFLATDLPVNLIATSHGILWRDNPEQIIEQYLRWSDAYQEDQITIIYDTMYNSTKVMAETIAAGILQHSPATHVKLFHAAKADKNDIITEVFRSKAVLLGSPTFNKGPLASLAAILEEFRGLKFTGKKASAFTSYGWSGEAAKLMLSELIDAGFETVDEGFRINWRMNADQRHDALQFGVEFASLVF